MQALDRALASEIERENERNRRIERNIWREYGEFLKAAWPNPRISLLKEQWDENAGEREKEKIHEKEDRR